MLYKHHHSNKARPEIRIISNILFALVAKGWIWVNCSLVVD